MKKEKISKTPVTTIKLSMRDWMRVNSGINGLNGIALPFALSLRFGILQRSLEPKIQQYHKTYLKAAESLGFKEGQSLNQEEQSALEEALASALTEEIEEKFSLIDPADLDSINVSPGVAAALVPLFKAE